MRSRLVTCPVDNNDKYDRVVWCLLCDKTWWVEPNKQARHYCGCKRWICQVCGVDSSTRMYANNHVQRSHPDVGDPSSVIRRDIVRQQHNGWRPTPYQADAMVVRRAFEQRTAAMSAGLSRALNSGVGPVGALAKAGKETRHR